MGKFTVSGGSRFR